MNTICMQCFYSLPPNAPCPRCGWRQGQDENPPGTLPLGCILNGRYQIGGVLRREQDRVVYRVWDSNKRKTAELTEFQPPGAVRRGRAFSSGKGVKQQARHWKQWETFLQNGTVYGVNLSAKKPKKGKSHWAVIGLCCLVLLLLVWRGVMYQSRARVWLPASAPQEYADFLKQQFRVTVIEDAEYTTRILEAAQRDQLPDVFYREGFEGDLDQTACPVDPARLETGDCSVLQYQKAYPSGLEVPIGWYVTVAYTHTHEAAASPEQLFSGGTSVCVAEDNWDDLMLVWTGDLSQTSSQLKQAEKVYRKQKTDPNLEGHFDLFTGGKIDWLVDDTLQRGYLTRYGSLVPFSRQGRMAGCYGAHWCLGTSEEKAYQVLKTLLSPEGQEALFPAGQPLLPLSDKGMEQVVEREPELAFLLDQSNELLLLGESRGFAYQKNNEMYKEIKENYEK